MTFRFIIIASVFFIFLKAQHPAEKDDFYKFGPFTAPTYHDLKEALKAKEPVYRLELKNVVYDSKTWEKISKLSQLISVRFFNNQLKSWPSGLEASKYLCYLSSYLNPLEEWMPFLSDLSSLQFLEIQHSKIDSIPARIAALRNLKTLRFGNTEDTLKLPQTFKYFLSLKELNIENVILDSNIHRIFKAKNIEKLILSGTRIKKLPGSIEKLQNLDVLILDNNELTSLPWEIGYLKKLRILRLVNNRLEKLPDTLSELENLSILDVRGNPLSAEELEKWKMLLPGCDIKF